MFLYQPILNPLNIAQEAHGLQHSPEEFRSYKHCFPFENSWPFSVLVVSWTEKYFFKKNSVCVQYLHPLGKITVLHLNKLYYKQVFGWNCRRALQKVVNILPLIFLFSFLGMIPYNLSSFYLRMHWAKFGHNWSWSSK